MRKIPFGKPWITDAERNAVLGVLAGDVLTHGPQAHEFEKEFAAAVGGGHALTLSNGTAALHLAYWQLGIGAGDEVIVPAQTHVATVHAVEVMGARPVFCDCDLETGNMQPNAIEALITPRTRAIGLVHFLGIPCDMPAIMKIAAKHNLKVVEDCALALGTYVGDVHAGLFGDAGTFSFHPVKHITTGDGGMLITKHADLAQKISKARAFWCRPHIPGAQGSGRVRCALARHQLSPERHQFGDRSRAVEAARPDPGTPRTQLRAPQGRPEGA